MAFSVSVVRTVHNFYECVLCCLHIKPFFLPNDISALRVRADSSS